IEEVWGHNPTDPPELALGPATWPADSDFFISQVNNPTAGDFSGVFATFAEKDGASVSPSQIQVGLQWGDGAFSRTGDGTGDLTVTSNGDGAFNVVGRHFYAAPGGTSEIAYLFVKNGDEVAWRAEAPIVLQMQTITVTSPLDDGSAGTLRWAVDQANSITG